MLQTVQLRDRLQKGAMLLLSAAMLFGMMGSSVAQQPMGHEDTIARPVPPAPPPREAPEEDEDGTTAYEQVAPDSDLPWKIDPKILANLQAVSTTYADYAKRFTSDETSRLAEYKKSGELSERVRKYAYLLVTDPTRHSVREFRQRLDRSGRAKVEPVDDANPFPPAYAWVYLFSEFNEPYFAYRYLDNRLEGFDWVHEIQFRGSLPFTDGKDIRQWEGRILIDAVTATPISIRAEPAGQKDRIEALYRQYVSSFNVLGMRTKPKPRGFKADVAFDFRSDNLSFPTRLRYDTFEAVSTTQVVPITAATRAYENYRFFQTGSGNPLFKDTSKPDG